MTITCCHEVRTIGRETDPIHLIGNLLNAHGTFTILPLPQKKLFVVSKPNCDEVFATWRKYDTSNTVLVPR